VDTARVDVNEEEDIVRNGTTERPNLFGEEVGCPERLDVALDKIVPSAFPSLWSRIKTVLPQDSGDGRAGDLDTELLEFSQESAVTQPVSVAIRMISSRISSGFRGRPDFLGLPFDFQPLAHRLKVLG